MRQRHLRRFLSAVFLGGLAGISNQVFAQDAALPSAPLETNAQNDARMAWWRDARFGMFIHWGLYAVPAGTWKDKQIPEIGEWIMNHARIPVADYAKFADQFNPTEFNADEWVSTAKSAGMKYIVITAKHHDGFAMFHSGVDPFNIFDATPFHRDPIAELAAACQKQGMKFGLYYSQSQDWHHPGGSAYGGHWDKAQDGDFDKYLHDKAVPQVKELLSNYGPISVLWWDTPDHMTPARAKPLREALRLQPDIIFNNRLGGGYKGDSETPEQTIPPNGFPGRDWETCMTINDTWGYKSYDHNFKSTKTLLTNLIDIASKGGNYLLNVGPTAQGIIPAPEIERLRQMGEWLNINGEAIYGSSAGPFKKQLSFGRATQKPGKLYLSIFSWPSDGTLTVPMTGKITRAYLLTTPDKSLTVTTGGTATTIELPGEAPDKIASVVVLEMDKVVPVP